MAVNGRRKGKAYELEIAALLRSYGFADAKRTGHRQAQIGDGSPDVEGLPGWFLECKRTKQFKTIYGWLEQAIRTCKDERLPIVFTRANGQESLVILRATDFLDHITEEE